MQATLPPARWWWETERWRRWSRRSRAGAHGDSLDRLHLHELQKLRDLHALLDRQKLTLPEILLYTPPRSGNIGEVMQSGTRPTLTWRQMPAPWDMTDYEAALKQLGSVKRESVSVESGHGAGGEGMWGAARGWAAGALLLLAALLILRATDRCLTRGYFRSRRRQSEEWPTPSVLATSQRPDDVTSLPNIAEVLQGGASPGGDPPDPPPPYSACAKHAEEPPPPYSACYAHKDGEPTVTLCMRTADVQDMQVAHSNNRFNHDEFSSGDLESSCGSPRLAPIASEDMSIGSSNDVSDSFDNRNNTIC